MNEAIKEVAAAVRNVPPIYYVADGSGSRSYLRQALDGTWVRLNEGQAARALRIAGLSSERNAGDTASELDRQLEQIQITNNVAFAGPLAGHNAGLVDLGAHKILVTSSPRLIKPVPGAWTIIHTLLANMLGKEQLPFLVGWLKVAYEALVNSRRVPGQAMVIAGEKDSGKSVVQKIITEILGGRCARPYEYMTGDTTFNAHLFGAEHLMVEDEAPSTDLRSRRRFGAYLKSITVNLDQQYHRKNDTPIMLSPFWRLSVTLNDEPENLMVLPVLDESLKDKITMLRSTRCAMPMPTYTTDEREKFWNALVAELPAFIDYFTKWEIPESMKDRRFLVTNYYNPDLLRALSELAPEHRLLTLIERYMVHEAKKTEWSGSAEELERSLTSEISDCCFEARKLLSFNNAMGTYLGRLSREFPNGIFATRSSAKRAWTIRLPLSSSS